MSKTNPISLDALNNKLLETIEMLQNNSDPNASDNEKIDVDSAKTIAAIGKVVVDGYRVKAQVMGIIAKSDTLSKELLNAASENGFIQAVEVKAIDK